MQLETGKAKFGLVGTLKNIIREEGYVIVRRVATVCSHLLPSAGRLYRGKCLQLPWIKHWRDPRSRAPFDARGSQTRRQIVSQLFHDRHLSIDFPLSASNDFWGKTYLGLSGESKMTQSLSILTGCSAGATVIVSGSCSLPFWLLAGKFCSRTLRTCKNQVCVFFLLLP